MGAYYYKGQEGARFLGLFVKIFHYGALTQSCGVELPAREEKAGSSGQEDDAGFLGFGYHIRGGFFPPDKYNQLDVQQRCGSHRLGIHQPGEENHILLHKGHHIAHEIRTTGGLDFQVGEIR